MDPGQNIASLASLSGYQELNRQDTIKFRDDVLGVLLVSYCREIAMQPHMHGPLFVNSTFLESVQ